MKIRNNSRNIEKLFITVSVRAGTRQYFEKCRFFTELTRYKKEIAIRHDKLDNLLKEIGK